MIVAVNQPQARSDVKWRAELQADGQPNAIVGNGYEWERLASGRRRRWTRCP